MTAHQQAVGDAIRILKAGKTLSADETAGAFRVIMSGKGEDGEIAELLTLLAKRTPTGEELRGAASIMRACVDPVQFDGDTSTLLDTCGTGGAPKTFNVSTASALVAAACGATVAKHGNRSRTGRGSAEVLERLGVNINADRASQQRCLNTANICFCFAPNHHPAIKHVMPIRRSLGFPTIFNYLGPLTNPCSAGRQLIGTWDAESLTPMAQSLVGGGGTRAAVVHSLDGLDECSVSANTRVIHVDGDSMREEVLKPTDMGLRLWPLGASVAEDLDGAVAMMLGVLDGTDQGAPRDMVLLNTALALVIAGLVSGVKQGVERSRMAIESGAVMETMAMWIECSQETT